MNAVTTDARLKQGTLALWCRLGLHQLLQELIPPGREKVAWELTACILTVARFCGEKSELGVA